MKALNAAILFKIGEEKSSRTITRNLYNDKGEAIAKKNDEQWEAEVESVKGKRTLFVEVICDGKTARYQSPHVEDDDIHIANALATVFVAAAGSIVKQFRKEPKERSRIIQLNGN